MLSQDKYWQIQDPKKPIFEDLFWSKPENKMQAGKLLIVGGNLHGFNDVALSFIHANKAGAGTIKVVLPDALKKVVGKSIENAYFCPTTPSGSFSRQALAELVDYGSWADMVLLAGNFGRNSETAIMLESFVDKYKGNLCLTKDALGYFVPNPVSLSTRPNTTIQATMAELQKISIKISPDNIIKFSMSLVQLVEALHNITEQIEASIVTKHLDNIIVAVGGRVSSTKLDKKFGPWRTIASAYSSVWLMQNSSKQFEALTCAIAELVDA